MVTKSSTNHLLHFCALIRAFDYYDMLDMRLHQIGTGVCANWIGQFMSQDEKILDQVMARTE